MRAATKEQVESLGARFVDTGVTADGAGGYARELTAEERQKQQSVVIEQVGTPREMYDRPSTSFVAGFVGSSNVLSAELSLRLIGVDAVHSVRPERIRIVRDVTSDAEASGEGVVDDIQFLGADCRLYVRLDDGTHLLASVPSDGLTGVAIGGPVRLAWPRLAAATVADTDISKGGDQ